MAKNTEIGGDLRITDPESRRTVDAIDGRVLHSPSLLWLYQE